MARCLRWIGELKEKNQFEEVLEISVELYGSLSLTGKGHATDIAVMLGLSGFDPVTYPIENIEQEIDFINSENKLKLNGELEVPFFPNQNIIFNRKFLEFHPNGMTFRATLKDGSKKSSSFYSIGGGFTVKKERKRRKIKMAKFAQFPFPVVKGVELLAYCKAEEKSISQLVLENEKFLRSEAEINDGLKKIWEVMLDSMYVVLIPKARCPADLTLQDALLK